MSLGFSRPVSVYLDKGLVIVRSAEGESKVIRHASDTHVLDMLDASLLPLAGARRAWQARKRYRFFLGAALCPALDYTIPQGVKRWAEKAVFIQQAAADLLGNSALVCAVDGVAPGIAAAMQRETLDGIRSWTFKNGGILQSAAPMWAVATHARRARVTTVSALILREPLGCTALLLRKGVTAQAFSFPSDDQSDFETSETVLRRWMVGAGLENQTVLRLRFTAEPKDGAVDVPGPWQSHWQAT